MIRPRPGPMARVMRFHGPPAFYGVDRGNRGAPGFSRHTHRVGMALTLRNLWCAPQCNLELSGSAPPPSANGTIWSISSRYRETAAPPAVPVDTAATTPVAAPHLPPHGCRDVPGPGAPQRAEAAQLRKVPLHGRRTPHRPHRANPGGVLKPLRRRTREPVAAPHRSPRHAAFAGFEMQPRRVGCAPEDTAHPRAPAIAVGSSLPLRQRSSPTAAATHRLRWPARVLRLATASRHRIGGATKALRFLDVRILLLPDSVRLRSGTSAALRGRRGGRAIGDRSRTAVHADAGEGRTSDGDSDGQPKVQLSELVTSAPHPRLLNWDARGLSDFIVPIGGLDDGRVRSSAPCRGVDRRGPRCDAAGADYRHARVISPVPPGHDPPIYPVPEVLMVALLVAACYRPPWAGVFWFSAERDYQTHRHLPQRNRIKNNGHQ